MAERRHLTRRIASAPLLAAVLVLLVLTGMLSACSQTSHAAPAGFVTSSGTSLRVDGADFRFVGFNLYDAAASDLYSCSPSTRLDDAGLNKAMRTIHDSGGTVVRFWAYQTYTAGGTDFSGVDRVLAAARANGLRVIPVLEDGQGNCSTGEPRAALQNINDGTWFSEGYRYPLGTATVSYRDYVATIAAHYRDDPTIVAWSLMNEAETSRRDAEGQSLLVGFARDVSAVVRAADPHHLITLGTQSNGAPGTSGADFSAIYGLPDIDLAEVHDWRFYGSDTEAMPGAAPDGTLPTPEQCQALDAKIACSFVLARQLDKPVFVGEAGIRVHDAADITRRSRLLRAKIAADFDAGAAGYLVWQLNVVNTDDYAIISGSDDPLLGVLHDASRRFPTY